MGRCAESSIARMLPALLVALLSAAGCGGGPPPEVAVPQVWRDLEPGTYAVGFTVEHEYDYSRTFRPKRDYDGSPAPGEIARPLQISVWYPAQAKVDPQYMVYGEYLQLSSSQFDFGRIGRVTLDQAIARAGDALVDRGADPSMVDSVMRRQSIVIRGAVPYPGRFPLIVYGAGYESEAWDNAVLFEYLASHGFIVASTPSFGMYSSGMTNDLLGLEARTRDHEFVIARMRDFPNVDNSRVGALGWDFGGLSVVNLSMRNHRVDAVAVLDGPMAYEEYRKAVEHSPDYSYDRLRVPFMYLAQAPVDLQDLSFFDELKYSNAYLLTFYDLMHYDFSSSHILSEIHAFAEGSGRDPERIDLGYAIACRYVLAFFQAYVNGDQEALAFLEQPPEAHQLPSDVLTIRRKKAIVAPPSREQFFGHIHAGETEKAVSLFHRAREVDPDVTLFTEELLSPLARELLNRGLTEEAIELFKLQVTAYPGSWSAHAALGDAYLEQGSQDLAAESYRKSLELNPGNEAARAILDDAGTGVTPAR